MLAEAVENRTLFFSHTRASVTRFTEEVFVVVGLWRIGILLLINTHIVLNTSI